MSKKNRAISGLAALAACLSSSLMMGAPAPEETLVEQDYSILLGGSVSTSRANAFTTNTGEAGFSTLDRLSSSASIGLTAFDRFKLTGHLGTASFNGCSSMQSAAGPSTMFSFTTDSSMLFGFSACGIFYQEGMVKASVFGSYEQASVGLSSAVGFVDMTKFTLIPSFNTASPPAITGLLIVPTANESQFALPTTGAATRDHIVLATPHMILNPKCSLDYYKYDLGGKIAYGQQIALFLGLKYNYSSFTLNCDERNMTTLGGEVMSGTMLDSFFGSTSGLTKASSTLASNFIPMIGCSVNSKCAQVSCSFSFLAENTQKVEASICF